MMPPGMQPPPGLRTRTDKPGEGVQGGTGKDSGMPETVQPREKKPVFIPDPPLSIDTDSILAACSVFGSLYLAHESELGETYRFDQVLGKFARLGDDVNTLVAVAPLEGQRATQDAALKNLNESMTVLEGALQIWRKKDALARAAENAQGSPATENWKGRTLRHIQNARAGRIDRGGTAPGESGPYRKEVQRFVKNDKGGLADLDRRIISYGLRSADAPEQIRFLFMRYFGTIHMQRVDARIRRFTALPEDPSLAPLHGLVMAYLTRTKALLAGYKAAEKAIVSNLKGDSERVAAIEADMAALQGDWATSFATLSDTLAASPSTHSRGAVPSSAPVPSSP